MSRTPTILVVEHDPLVCRALEESLDRIGLEGVLVNSGEHAVQWLNQNGTPGAAMALIDVELPGNPSGPVLGHHCHAIYRIPFLYIAGHPDQLQNPQILESQPHGYLLREFEDSELLATLTLAAESPPREGDPSLATSQNAQVVTPSTDSEATIVTDLAGRITYLNTLAEDLTGWRLGEAANRPYQEVFRLIDGQGNPVAHEPLAPGRDRSTPTAATLARHDGQHLPIRERTSSLTHADGSLAGLFIAFGPVFDTSPMGSGVPSAARHAANGSGDHSQTSEPTIGATEAVEVDPAAQHFGAMLAAITDPIFALDRNWHVTYANRPAEELLDRPPHGLIGKDFREEFTGAEHAKHVDEYAKALSEQRPRAFEFYHDSLERWLEAHAYPFSQGLLVLLRDITERRNAQERASKLEKLEGLGLLARGFAHDFNNLLTVLLGNVSLAKYARPGESDYHEPLDAAKHATEQARNLVQQLLTFAKGGAPITKKIDLNKDVIREVLALHKKQPHIDYHLQLSKDTVMVEADPGQVRRLLANLIRNAEEAMLSGGRLRLSSHIVPSTGQARAELPTSLDPKTEYVVLEVHDTGEGIPDVHLEKIFEPYFSTRTDANATGLGLTVCESIARAHKGFLHIDSRYGSHTTARLFLPTLRQDWRPHEKTPTQSRALRTSPRVLILDDEKPIRLIMSICLKKDGYEVVETEEGSQTVAAYAQALQEGRRFDLVIMDLSIPNGMGGAEAIQQIRYADPNVVAVVSSGYSDDPVMANFKHYGFSAVLPKPYEPSSLRQLAQRLIQGEGVPVEV